MNSNLILVIPCFNEEKKLDENAFFHFLQANEEVFLCFVNDGSTDQTLSHLQTMEKKSPNKVKVVHLEQNVGKAEAVRSGMNYCLKNYAFQYIGYLDADLSVTLEECASMTVHLQNGVEYCFGSRMAKVGSTILRKRSRFLIGRFVATLISYLLELKVYDTQCGCKLFTKPLAESVFNEKFLSKWLFDVEIFFRIFNLYGKDQGIEKSLEIPLKYWADKGDSKVKNTYFFYLFLDLYRIRKKYKRDSKTKEEESFY